MQAISRSNDGFKYILTVIDIFSKYAWAIPVKTKSSGDMVEAFTDLFNRSKPRTPQRLQTDAGKEFINKEVQSLLKNHNIHFFYSGKKAADKKAESSGCRAFQSHPKDAHMDILLGEGN